jgi:hypothetical protein
VKRDIRGLIESARKRGDQKFSIQLYVFLACLVISVFLWALVRLSKEYYYTVDYKLVYTGTPSMLRLSGVSDTVLTLKLKAQGYDFFMERVMTGGSNRYEVSLRQMRLKPAGAGYKGYLLTPSLGYEIVSQTGYPHSYLSTTPDTIFFEFERKAARRDH